MPTNASCNLTWIESRKKDGNQSEFTALFCPEKLQTDCRNLDIGIHLQVMVKSMKIKVLLKDGGCSMFAEGQAAKL